LCKKIRSKRTLGFFMIILALLVGATGERVMEFAASLPNRIVLYDGQSVSVSALPMGLKVTGDSWIDVDSELGPGNIDKSILPTRNLSVSSDISGEGRLKLKLFGIFPIKTISVSAVDQMMVIPGGHAIGMKIKSQGVIALRYDDVKTDKGTVNPARAAGIEIGDFILSVNDETLINLDHAAQVIGAAGGETLSLIIDRDGEILTKTVCPAFDIEEHTYRIGIWIRDSAAGIGTLTYYDPQENAIGALGHVISDSETGKAVDLWEGEILSAEIVSLVKGQKGSPGGKRGAFQIEPAFSGLLTRNNDYGVFGLSYEPIVNDLYPEPIPVAPAAEVKTGPATILTVLSGTKIEAFDIDIERVFLQDRPTTKSLILKVTDPELLAATGGIIQGMSGSPIIQDEKLVGAVTHVLVNDPTRGYGIFIENMLEAAE